jgi:uncharacterized membrane protein YhaH (DUF805 family)
MVNLLFNPQGRIGPGEFWRGFLILLVVGIAINVVALYLAPPVMAIGISLIAILLIYPSLCVYGKRFHDAGKSAWNYLFVLIGGIILVAIATAVVNNMVATDLAADIQERIREESQSGQASFARIMELSMELQRARFIPAMLVQLTITFVIGYIVSILKSDPDENRFGPPPGAAAASQLAA